MRSSARNSSWSTGYPGGGDINLAIERGEIDGRSNYWTGWTTVKPEWIRDRKLEFLFRTGPRAPRHAGALPLSQIS